MGSNLEKFLRERYGAHPLLLATERDVPGMLVEADWSSGFFLGLGPADQPHLRREDGLVWDLLGLDPAPYASSRVEANIIQESITSKQSFGGEVDLPQFGLAFRSALARELTAAVEVTGIHARVFDDTSAPFQLMQLLLAKKGTDPDLWNWVNDDFLITESYYVTSLTAHFRKSGDLSARAAFERAGFETEGSLGAAWHGDSELELLGSAAAPVAVRGFKV